MAHPRAGLDAELRDVLLHSVRTVARSAPAFSGTRSCIGPGYPCRYREAIRAFREPLGRRIHQSIVGPPVDRDYRGLHLVARPVAKLASVVPAIHRVRLIRHCRAAFMGS